MAKAELLPIKAHLKDFATDATCDSERDPGPARCFSFV